VLEQSGLTPGRPLGYRDVQRAIQTLYATGQFDDVRVAQDTAGGASSWSCACMSVPCS